MNRKKSIEYSEKNWNPFTGCSNWKRYDNICNLHKDCWAYGMAQRLRGRYGYDLGDPFKPTFHPDKLDVPLHRRKPTIYATSFMGDISYCPDKWLIEILNVIRQCPQHTFIMLTKRPSIPLFRTRSFPDNVWLGTTVTKNGDIYRIHKLKQIDVKHRWASFEPLYEKMGPNLSGIDGIAIGAKTGAHPYQPEPDDIIHLIAVARKYDTKIVIKENLKFEPRFIEWP